MFSLSDKNKKKYGLIMPNKIFSQESSSDIKNSGNTSTDNEETADLRAEQERQLRKRKVQEMQRAALAEDASVFDYDGVYDEMKAAQSRSLGVAEKKSRYVESMLKQAEERQRHEIRYQERRIQRELEQELQMNPDLAAEGGMQSFVTDAYREQKEQVKKLEEEERLKEEAERERMMKQGMDRSRVGFYQKILDTRAKEVAPITGTLEKKKEKFAVDAKKKEEMVDYSLKGGLNVFRKPSTTTAGASSSSTSSSYAYKRQQDSQKYSSKERDRYTQEFERQLEERERELEKKRLEEEDALKKQFQRQTDEDALAEAKRRFEERRKKRATAEDTPSTTE